MGAKRGDRLEGSSSKSAIGSKLKSREFMHVRRV